MTFDAATLEQRIFDPRESVPDERMTVSIKCVAGHYENECEEITASTTINDIASKHNLLIGRQVVHRGNCHTAFP